MTNNRSTIPHQPTYTSGLIIEKQSVIKHLIQMTLCSIFTLCFFSSSICAQSDGVLVTVNKKTITQSDLEMMYIYRQIPKVNQREFKNTYVKKLIDEELIRQFLKKKKVHFFPEHVDAQIEILRKKIIKNEKDPDEIFSSMGFDQEKLKLKVARDIQWNNYILKKATSSVLRNYFKKEHEKFDGTTVQASQIFLKSKNKKETDKKLLELERIKNEIESGTISFSDAAKKYSQARSASQGGTLGTFPYRGEMPVELTKIIFQLSPGKISSPVKTRYGVHLYQVVKKTPGDLSLEDVRLTVINQYSNDTWDKTVAKLRSKASIKYKK